MKPDGDLNYASNPYGYPPAPPRRRGLLALGASVVGIAAFAGVVLYAYNRVERVGPDGGPPLLEADTTPTKLRPEQPGGMDVPHQDKLVYDRLNQSAKDDRPKVEHLLPPPEQPLPRPVVTPQVPAMPALPPPPAVAPLPAPPAGATTTVPRGVPDDVLRPVVPASPVQVQAGLPPALPTGGQSSQVASLPSAPPKAPPKPPQLATAPGALAPKPVPPPPQAAQAPPKAPPPVAAAPATAPAAGTLTAPKIPAAGPSTGPSASGAASASAGGSGFRIQLASVRSEAEAAAEWKRLAGRHPDALGGLSMRVAKADLGEKGVFYRVQGGSVDEARAKSICAQLQAQNVGCVVVRP